MSFDTVQWQTLQLAVEAFHTGCVSLTSSAALPYKTNVIIAGAACVATFAPSHITSKLSIATFFTSELFAGCSVCLLVTQQQPCHPA
jgi:hypothetical protein